jgi:hypothetical protein
MRSLRLAGICASLVLIVLIVEHPAQADTLLLENGDYVTGDLRLVDLTVTTADGVVPLTAAEISYISLGGIRGDVVILRGVGELTGRIDEVAYSIRLRSGHTLVFGRNEVGRIIFHRR